MARLKTLAREEMNEEQRQAFDAAKAAGAPTGGPYAAYLRLPKLMGLTRAVGDCIRAAALTARERQLAVMMVIRHWDAEYPWAVQSRASLAAGLSRTELDAINARRKPELTDARERAVWDVVSELLARHRVTNASYGAAARLLGEEALVALVAAVGYFSMVSCTVNAFDMAPPEDAPARLA